jgi:single-stranded-DNA-specific exonuclease
MGFEAVDLKSYLDLVCLGTVADMVPLTGENRIFASAGLKALGATTRPGLIALMTVAGIKEINDPQQIGFQLGPRLNAAGRLESAKAALRLLLTTDAHEAADLANDLNRTNEERQQLERAIFQEAKTWLRDNFVPERDWVIVAGNNSWHIGVVGIVASRIQHEFHRPAVVFGGDGSSWRGSARSIAGFDIAQAFHQCADLLSRHGGHSMAAGLSMAPENFSRFWERINSVAHQQLTLDHLTPELLIDAEVELGEITLERLIELGELQPFGIGNRPVHLAVRGVWHQQPPQRFGKEEKHVRFRVTDGKSVREAIWWNAAEAPLPKVAYDLAFVPELNHYNGLTTLRLRVLDWAPVTSLKATES